MKDTAAKPLPPTNARQLHLLFVISGLAFGAVIGRVVVANPISMPHENWEALVVNLTIVSALLLTTLCIMTAKSLYRKGAYKLGWLFTWVAYVAPGSVIGSIIGAFI